MFKRGISRCLPILVMVFIVSVHTSSALAKEGGLKAQLLKHAGESYPTVQDPSYQNYEMALREYIANRIHQRFGIALDPKNYSGFDLLEIEALFKVKKNEESFDTFLKKFPKHP